MSSRSRGIGAHEKVEAGVQGRSGGRAARELTASSTGLLWLFVFSFSHRIFLSLFLGTSHQSARASVPQPSELQCSALGGVTESATPGNLPPENWGWVSGPRRGERTAQGGGGASAEGWPQAPASTYQGHPCDRHCAQDQRGSVCGLERQPPGQA